jgi:hypothetical protein
LETSTAASSNSRRKSSLGGCPSRPSALQFRVGVRVGVSGFRVQGSGFRVQVSGFRI